MMNNNIMINPEKDLRDILLSVQLPGRYVGGEYGQIRKRDPRFRMALSFPDLYEIGMSNLAIRILYRELNALESVACERIFAPAPDFEELLKQKGVPLYTIESGTPLNRVDLLGFSIGYELSATNMLTILETGNIPLLNVERGEGDPVVIAGGPAVTNPAPFGKILDGVWLGEAEDEFTILISEMSEIKKRNGCRESLIEYMSGHPNIWIPGSGKKTVRSLWKGFSSSEKITKGFIVPNISTVQDHGIVEIMRGCPSGCRFCHAGYFYRPYRQKSIARIEAEVESLISDYGYREITLSSLSSGDYSGINNLISRLNRRWHGEHISFAVPSMRVNSVTLPLLAELSRIRKSGLTFAVETPDQGKQAGLNKEVPLEKILDILSEAKNMGWNLAKFYFMTGLPFSNEDEGLKIADFLNEIQRNIKIKINANIGTFIPKPHTPFQWSSQLNEEEALKRIQDVRFNTGRGIKVGYHSPFISTLEGVLSRGGEEISDLILSAYKNGARLDAWDEYINKDVWRNEFDKTDIVKKVFRKKELSDPLPWDGIDLGFSKKFLIRELERAENEKLTDPCSYSCNHNCGVCNSEVKPVDSNGGEIDVIAENHSHQKETNSAIPSQDNYKELQNNIHNRSMEYKYRMLFGFSKIGKAEYYSHINIMQIFERTFLRAAVPVRFTEGFNPKPRLEFAHPLALGYSSVCEIAAIDLNGEYSEEDFKNKINLKLPEGIRISRAKLVIDKPGVKRKSLMSIFGGSSFSVYSNEEKLIQALRGTAMDWGNRGVSLEDTDKKSCVIKILQPGKDSSPGIKKILKSNPEIESAGESALMVERTELYSRKDGSFISYFDYFT